jgi:hypothetical protein
MIGTREQVMPWQRAYAALLPVHERTAALRVFERSIDPFATLCMLFERQTPPVLALKAGDVALQYDPNLHEVSVYPLIDRLLGEGVAPLSNNQREELIAAFRRACILSAGHGSTGISRSARSWPRTRPGPSYSASR